MAEIYCNYCKERLQWEDNAKSRVTSFPWSRKIVETCGKCIYLFIYLFGISVQNITDGKKHRENEHRLHREQQCDSRHEVGSVRTNFTGHQLFSTGTVVRVYTRTKYWTQNDIMLIKTRWQCRISHICSTAQIHDTTTCDPRLLRPLQQHRLY